MSKGSYNISVPGGSNFEGGGYVTSDEGELENRECMNSCLSPVFLRSLSFHDRPRSSRGPINKEFRCTRYKKLVSSSLEKIPIDLLLPSERKSQSDTYRSEPVEVNAEAEVATHSAMFNEFPPAANQQTSQNPISGWLEDRYKRFGTESEKLLEKTIGILSAIDRDVSDSLTNLTKPESIALESVIEIYRNKIKKRPECSVASGLDLSAEISSRNVWEKAELSRSKDVQIDSTPQKPKDLQTEFFRQSPKTLQSGSPRESPKTLQSASPRHSPKTLQSASPRHSPKILQSTSSRGSPQILQSTSFQESPKTLRFAFSRGSLKTLKSVSFGQSPETLQSASSRESSKNLQSPKKNLLAQCSRQSSEAFYFQQSPQKLPAESSQHNPTHLQVNATSNSPKHLPVHSTQQTLTNLPSLLSSNAGNTQSLNEPDQRSVEECSKNVSSTPKRTAPDSTSAVKSPFIFDLPSDHEQFVKIIGALQNRCLEYREMVQDIAISALEECLNFSEISTSRIRHLRKQFESQKRNFKDFKELCCKSVVFGPDSLPIDNKVTEVIQSFYLKLLQEENETFMARLEFGLKMGEVYTRILKYETENQKIIKALEKEILHIKKISIGFKV